MPHSAILRTRTFSPADDAMIRAARDGRMPMRELRELLRTSLPRIYQRMAELGLDPYRKPDRRTRPAFRRDYLRLLPTRAATHGARSMTTPTTPPPAVDVRALVKRLRNAANNLREFHGRRYESEAALHDDAAAALERLAGERDAALKERDEARDALRLYREAAGHEAGQRDAAEAERDAERAARERAEAALAGAWQPFDYENPPEGVYWLEIERPETWCDAGDDGRSIGGYTGKVRRLVVLAGVYAGEDGPEFERVGGGEYGEVEDDDTPLRFMPLTPPEPRAALQPQPHSQEA